MNGLLAVLTTPIERRYPSLRPLLSVAALAAALFLATTGHAQDTVDPDMLSLTAAQLRVDDLDRELSGLTGEREVLAKELDQYKRTLVILQRDDTPPEQSSNPAVRTLALEMVSIRERLISVTEREVTLLQEQITLARQMAAVAPVIELASADQTTSSTRDLRALRGYCQGDRLHRGPGDHRPDP